MSLVITCETIIFCMQASSVSNKTKNHKYANQLICLIESLQEGQYFRFNLIPGLMFYDN